MHTIVNASKELILNAVIVKSELGLNKVKISFSKMLRQASLTVLVMTVLPIVYWLNSSGAKEHIKSTVHEPSKSRTVNGT